MTRRLKILLAIVVGMFVLSCAGLFIAVEIPFLIVFGWTVFLVRTVPQMTVEPAALAVGGVALLLAMPIAHGLAKWLYAAIPTGPEAPPRPDGKPRNWRFRWTLSTVSLVVLLFAAGIAGIVIVHESGWLLTSSQPWLDFQGFAREAARRAASANNLRQIGFAFSNYHDAHHQYPAGGTFNEQGEMLHSWETMLLPYLEHPETPNLKLPWNHPENAKFFQEPNPAFLNPGISNGTNDVKDQQGYWLSHYAVNRRVLGGNYAVRRQDVTDGTSNTIMAGEVKANFKPWGHPVNWRDPADGVQKSPDGFGGPWSSGMTQFLMMDGSVRRVSPDIDPQVLKALATPAGGEKIPSDWEN